MKKIWAACDCPAESLTFTPTPFTFAGPSQNAEAIEFAAKGPLAKLAAFVIPNVRTDPGLPFSDTYNCPPGNSPKAAPRAARLVAPENTPTTCPNGIPLKATSGK